MSEQRQESALAGHFMVVKGVLASLVILPLLVACVAVGDREAAPTSTVSSAPTPQRTGPVEYSGGLASCAEGYSPKTLRNRDFAFDGTIVAIGPGGTNKPDKGHLETAAVTFKVNEWFKGGAGNEATVDLLSPNWMAGDDTPLYEVGTRLLVSGEPRWGGPPLEDAIALSCGGFTRYYESAFADEWRAALPRE